MDVTGRGADLPEPVADVARGDTVSVMTLSSEAEVTITDPTGRVTRRLLAEGSAEFVLDEAGRYEI